MQVVTAMTPAMAKRKEEAAAKEQVTADQLEGTRIVQVATVMTARTKARRGVAAPAKPTITALKYTTTRTAWTTMLI